MSIIKRKNKKFDYQPRYYKGEGNPYAIKHKFDEFRSSTGSNTSLKGKINVVKEKQDITLSVKIKHRKDSVIWLSISAPFGIEIIRAQVTPDSIYFVNRTQKTILI